MSARCGVFLRTFTDSTLALHIKKKIVFSLDRKENRWYIRKKEVITVMDLFFKNSIIIIAIAAIIICDGVFRCC